MTNRTTRGLAARMATLGLVGALGAGGVAAQQTADFIPEAARGADFELSIRNIMRGPEHIGSAPSGIRFSDDGDWIYFSWKPGG